VATAKPPVISQAALRGTAHGDLGCRDMSFHVVRLREEGFRGNSCFQKISQPNVSKPSGHHGPLGVFLSFLAGGAW
jgi:hypothetical protein